MVENIIIKIEIIENWSGDVSVQPKKQNVLNKHWYNQKRIYFSGCMYLGTIEKMIKNWVYKHTFDVGKYSIYT